MERFGPAGQSIALRNRRRPQQEETSMTSFRTAALAVSSLITLAAAIPASAEDSIAFASWGGLYQDAERKAFLEPTAQELGIKINDFTESEGLADIRTQVKAGAIQWDIAEFYGGQCQQAADEGLLEPLDYNVINTDGIPKDLVQPYWVGITAYGSVLAWNKEKYKDNPPKSWADFFDTKKFPGTRALSGYGGTVNLEVALMADGVDKDKLYPLDLDRAFKKLEEIKPDIDVWWASGAQQTQLVQNQEADMLQIWVSRLAGPIKEGAPYAYTYNQGVIDIECLVVPKGTAKKELAMKVINNFLKPEIQANLPQYIPYAPVNQKAYDTGKITPEMVKESITAPDNLKQQVVLDKAWWAANGQKVQERWDAFMQK
jgi:putative spermidine/putrescine transport system substrate-binding protein